MTLTDRLNQLNKETLDWVNEDPTNRFAGTLTTDLAHWKSYGITTAEELNHYLLVSDVYETTKEKWGYKPSWKELMQMSEEDLKKRLKEL
jgi:hypothetical protein